MLSEMVLSPQQLQALAQQRAVDAEVQPALDEFALLWCAEIGGET